MNFIFILKLILMSDINQLKHFDALDYKGEYFTNELKDGDYTHLFGYLNPYYRTAYSISKRKR